MTEQEIFALLVPLVRQVTGAKLEQVTMDAYLVGDLGAESIDLLDLSFLIEETFAVTLEPDEFENKARAELGDDDYDDGGVLTARAVEQLRIALPEVDPELIRPGMRKIEVPGVLNVAVFVHLIGDKLASQRREVKYA
ncbi:MAG: acyl carrier protein [Phycisphaerae bacterium]|jgi:acyl carrier protein|nr:acyl carrier protein [Phycisphaerae bacterium]